MLGAATDRQLTITELAANHSVSLRTLRFYEQMGLLEPERCGVQRLYGQKDVIRLQLIQKGKRLGFTLREIQQIISGHARREDCELMDFSGALDNRLIVDRLASFELKKRDIDEAIAELNQKLTSDARL